MEEPAQKKNVFLVDNPVSGTTDSFIRREAFLQHFEEHQWACEVYETTPDETVSDAVRRAIAGGVDLVVACGGDGTVAAVASGMIDTGVPLAIIPAGTGNILARDLGIPLRFERALELITGDHEVINLDTMQVKDQVYVLNLGVGVSSNIMAKTDREQKRRFGMLAYIWNGLGQLTGFRLSSFAVQVDDKFFNLRASEIMVVNSSIVGIQHVPNTVDIDPTDGSLDVCIFRARTLWDLVVLTFNVLLGRKERSVGLRCAKATKRITIRSARRLAVQADGEIIGETPVEIKVLSGALRVIVPPRSA